MVAIRSEEPGERRIGVNRSPLTEDRSRPMKIRELLERIAEDKKYTEQNEDTKKKKREWKFPAAWKRRMGRGTKSRDKVVVLYLNIKGEIEQPVIVPLYSGNMVIIRHKPYEIDPRAFWLVRVGMKTHKVLIIKEIDRRPVSNLDYSEIRKRGDATDSDEILLKASLRAQLSAISKPVNKAMIVIVVLIIVGIVGYILLS